VIRGLLAFALVVASCGGAAAPTARPASAETSAAPTAAETIAPPASPTSTDRAAFLSIRLSDVRTGQAFTLGDFPGKVTLAQSMAVW
jgi:hypothetical protein